MSRRILFGSLLAILLLCFPLERPLGAQVQTGSIHGTILDPSGAAIPSVEVSISNHDGYSQKVTGDANGIFSVDRLVPGRYSLSVTRDGFAPAQLDNVMVYGAKTTTRNISLKLAVEQQQVTVSDQGISLDTSSDNNASSIVIKGKALDALSDDPDDLENELSALAGPAAGPNGGQIYIDGFTGGQLPPKSSIREIRINQNPFSSQYDKLGYGRIEIFTKPGTDKFHGMLMVNGNDSPFNSRNPFVTSEPSYYSTFYNGNVSGALTQKSSWFLNFFSRSNQTNSIIDAELLDTNNNEYNYTKAVSTPQTRVNLSPRFDFQLTPTNTLSVRYMYDRQKATNSGISQFALESQGYDTLNQEHTIQISDTQSFGSSIVNETRFQYSRQRDNQIARSTDPTITVQGAFTSGGNSSGTVRDNQDRYEFQNYTTWVTGKNSINFGTRLRLTRESTYSTSGFNGTYTYSSLTAPTTGTDRSYESKQPSQYSVTTGNASSRVNLFDGALFFQDDYKLTPNLTLGYGLRFEGQNRINDHSDLAPRVYFAYAPAFLNHSTSKTIIRGGYGWFYDRFKSSYVLEAIQHNGVNQQQYVIKDPTFYENAPSASQLAALSTTAPTVYQVSPNLKTSVNMQAALGVEHQFGKVATVAATYINSHGIHQYLSNNINAYLPETYDYTTNTGTRPNGINENIYQYQSGGLYNQNQLMVNYTIRAKRLSLFGFYMLNYAKADTSGATYFSSNPFNPRGDYGRASFDVRNRFLIAGNIQAPFGISLSPMMVFNSGTPFNITLGQDLNGDNQYNDRPAFATASSTNTVATKYGTFDTTPTWNQTRIPYDMGTGPSQFSANMRVSKSFGIGPRVSGGNSGVSGGGQGGPGGPPPGGGGPGGGGGGGGLGPGGFSRSGPPKLDQEVPRRYSLTFAAMARNVFNNVNLSAPVGVLNSSMFGKSNSLAGGFFSQSSANRSIDLQMSFSF